MPVVAMAKAMQALLISKRPGNHLILVNQKKKKNLSFAHEDAMACIPVGTVVFEGS